MSSKIVVCPECGAEWFTEKVLGWTTQTCVEIGKGGERLAYGGEGDEPGLEAYGDPIEVLYECYECESNFHLVDSKLVELPHDQRPELLKLLWECHGVMSAEIADNNKKGLGDTTDNLYLVELRKKLQHGIRQMTW